MCTCSNLLVKLVLHTALILVIGELIFLLDETIANRVTRIY
jgi:hypothetical protein